MFEFFIFTTVHYFYKSNKILKSAKKTRSSPGREALSDAHNPPPFLPSGPVSTDPAHLAVDLCPRTLTSTPALPPAPLSSHLCPCPLTCAPALSPVSLPSHLCPCLLTCVPALSPTLLSSYLCPIFSPVVHPLTTSPECVAFLQVSGRVRWLEYISPQGNLY